MTRKRFVLLSTLVGTVLSLAASGSAKAQSADALIDKLVEKGILSVKEANDLRTETDKNFTTAYSIKSGMPDWVNSFQLNGDVRARVENFTGDNPAFEDRLRFRYRVRLGATILMYDNFEVGLRLTSSDATEGSFGGDPISGNTTFRDNGSKKFVYFDAAYGKWNFLNTPLFSSSVVVGKMDNPFIGLSDGVYDPDYTPEGIATAFGCQLSDQHKVKLVAGAFVLDELATSSQDPYLLGAQLIWDAAWTPKFGSTLSGSVMSIQNRQFLTNGAVPNINRGNTRDLNGAPQYDFNPVIGDAVLTYTLDKFPAYKDPFPIRVFGEYMYNPSAPSEADNYAWMAGLGFGKSGKKGLWELSYRYKWLGANSWWEELTDSDWGAFYQAGLPNDGFKTASNPTGQGYGTGTNTRGHLIRAAWSLADGFTLAATYMLTDLINPSPAESKSGMGRLQVDAVWKY